MSDRPKDILFYVLSSTDEVARETFITKLVNKIYQQNRQCDICMDSDDALHRLDMLLWDYKPHSFIPHATANERPAPIQLWHASVAESCHDVFINIHPEFPPNFTQYQRTIEVLDQSEQLIHRGRERWKQYKAQGFEPIIHKL